MKANRAMLDLPSNIATVKKATLAQKPWIVPIPDTAKLRCWTSKGAMLQTSGIVAPALQLCAAVLKKVQRPTVDYNRVEIDLHGGPSFAGNQLPWTRPN